METEREAIQPCYQTDDETNEIIWIDYEYTLFCGERLIAVEKCEEHIQLIFEGFKVGVMSFDKCDEDKVCTTYDGISVLGAERLITRKCSCGGTRSVCLTKPIDNPCAIVI